MCHLSVLLHRTAARTHELGRLDRLGLGLYSLDPSNTLHPSASSLGACACVSISIIILLALVQRFLLHLTCKCGEFGHATCSKGGVERKQPIAYTNKVTHFQRKKHTITIVTIAHFQSKNTIAIGWITHLLPSW